jgi:pimeloyl-ACP methyl ester carboxylesterase
VDEDRFRRHEQALWASVGVTPSERRVRLERTGCTVRVQESGRGPALLLFVHGAANGGSSWADLVARLDGFRCVLLDRPGCALSDPLPAPLRRIEDIEVYADGLIADLLDALDRERAHVVATSYGGYFALRGAAAHPDRFDRIVELGWTIGAPMAKVPPVMRVMAVPGVGRLSGLIPRNERVVRRILRQVGLGRALESGAFTPAALDWFTSVLRDTPTMRNELKGTPRVILPIGGMNERVLLPATLRARIAAPTLFLWGEDDPNGGATIARDFVAPFPDARLELLADAGHSPWIDEPDRVAAAMTSFLTQSRGAA